MTDLTKTVAPKTDQLNADDFIGKGSRTIKIMGVKAVDSKEQPISIPFEGDGGKPWKPCLGMRRVLIELWGEEAAKEADKNYKGREVTLYRDPNIKFGKEVMGGIRISHASHISSEKKILVTVSKARRIEYIVKPLEKVTVTPPSELEAKARRIINTIKIENTVDGLTALFETDFKDDFEFVKKENGKTYQYLVDALENRRKEIEQPQ